MEIHFKPIEYENIDQLVHMMEDFYAIDNYPIDIKTSKKLFENFIENEHLGKGWLIMDKNNPIGYIILTFCFSFEYQGRIAFLDELYVTEAARGKGIGKKALTFLKEEYIKQSLKIVYLEVEPHNNLAQKLYLNNDFKTHKRNLMKYTVK